MRGNVLVMRIHDGAYGSLLQRHLHGDETVDDLCLREPTLVIDAHRAYLDAGATALQTNAFLAHLRTTSGRRERLQLAALDCAREAVAASAREDVLVLATIGPIGTDPREYWRDLELLLEDGASAVQCETVTDRRIADAFLTAWDEVARGVRDVPVLLGCSVAPSQGAEAMRWVLELASDAPEHVELGLNCCEGPTGLRPLLDELSQLRSGAWTMPSAGLPVTEAGHEPRWPFADPRDWAEAIAELVDGLQLGGIGGCCGTTPDHISALMLG
jgi:methionine synthase I (cobalamin-dependent)